MATSSCKLEIMADVDPLKVGELMEAGLNAAAGATTLNMRTRTRRMDTQTTAATASAPKQYGMLTAVVGGSCGMPRPDLRRPWRRRRQV